MFKKKKDERHHGERYPGGKQNTPTGAPPRKPKICFQSFGIKIGSRRPARISQCMVEKLFMITIFIVLEVMIGWAFFHMMDNTFDSSNFPEDVRGMLKLAQVAMFVIFTYANIMASFFKVNIFQ